MKGLSAREHQSLILSVGTHATSRRLSPLEVSALISKAIRSGMTRSQCADALRVKADQISRFLRLLKLNPEVSRLAGWGRKDKDSIPFTTLTYLDRLSSDDQFSVAEAALTHRLTKEEVKQIVQIAVRSGDSAREATQKVLQLRPQVEERHAYLGIIRSRELQRSIETLNEEQRRALIQRALSTVLGCHHGAHGQLSPFTFSVSSKPSLTDLTGMDADQIEVLLNRVLDRARNSPE